ncbi:MAG: phosphatase PAP2 family protein [Planctomycetota bacterium]
MILGGTFATGLALDSSWGASTEKRFAQYFETNDVIPNSLGSKLDALGTGAVLLGAAGIWVGSAHLWGGPQQEEASLAMLSSLSITGLSTLALKPIIQDERPNGAAGGYPSGHSAMAMAAAASLGESYGWKIGLPAYLTAFLVGVQRLDTRRHDVDDVLGGFALGWVVGTSVTSRRMPRVLGGKLEPIVEPQAGTYGLAIAWDF